MPDVERECRAQNQRSDADGDEDDHSTALAPRYCECIA
jgi:hypothetical protein